MIFFFPQTKQIHQSHKKREQLYQTTTEKRVTSDLGPHTSLRWQLTFMFVFNCWLNCLLKQPKATNVKKTEVRQTGASMHVEDNGNSLRKPQPLLRI